MNRYEKFGSDTTRAIREVPGGRLVVTSFVSRSERGDEAVYTASFMGWGKPSKRVEVVVDWPPPFPACPPSKE